MATSTAVAVEEYLHTSYEPDMEYVNGQLVARHVGEYFHSRMQVIIGSVLGERARECRFRVFTASRVRVSTEPRYRIPDISVKALPHTVTPVLERPDLVVEILTPDDTVSEMLVKVADYLQAGIAHVWIVDPYRRTVVEADREGTRAAVNLTAGTELAGDVDFAALFAELDEPAE